MLIIPTSHQDLIKDKTRSFLFLATLMPNGSPQVTPVWFSVDNGHILINTAEGRVKDRNIRARPQVALVIQDPGTPYRYLQIRGRVESFTEEGGDEHINALSLKYDGKPWKKVERQTRVIFKILPEHVDAH